MTDIAEITIRTVSNGWVVVCIGDGGTDEAIARDVHELCSVLREVLGEEGGPIDPAWQREFMASAAPPATPTAVKTEGPISVGEEFKCSCGDGGEWPRVDYCASEGCPFESAP